MSASSSARSTSWDDPPSQRPIRARSFRSTPITVVTRSDGSGTTFVFTTHLSAISPEWKAGPGAGKSVNFPVGVAGKGNAGVTALIKQTPGAIGYVEYGYARQTKMPMAELENQAGKYVQADLETGQHALATAQLPENLGAWITDPARPTHIRSSPILGYFVTKSIRIPRSPKPSKTLVSFGLTAGQKDSEALGYIPLPANVIDKVRKPPTQIS